MAAAFKKAAKAGQRQHRERSQLSSRKHLGLLEKKKDYKLRAEDYHKKQNALRALRRKAQEKNPDEFYHRMTRVQLQDGIHLEKPQEEECTLEQQKLMKTQDLKYIEMKRVAEVKKIERLKSELHLLEAEGKQPNKHTFFFDTKREVREFDIAAHLNTAPELLGRVYNRPTLEMLKKEPIRGATLPVQLQSPMVLRGTHHTVGSGSRGKPLGLSNQACGRHLLRKERDMALTQVCRWGEAAPPSSQSESQASRGWRVPSSFSRGLSQAWLLPVGQVGANPEEEEKEEGC
nr:PREDICTED: probable U3 small nucleolar RNA-associated protein 11 isoform X1 [Anolis carolinensis]|eukprot:XP_016852605.1 PREDICTED: probable U3 small nucleolar RNA-associated protein 11 isoform X1 [Anolis carolinensis]